MPEQLPKWQAIGTEPTIELQTNGWQPGMKPSAQHMNWLFNRAYKCLEDLQNNKADLTALSTLSQTVSIIENQLSNEPPVQSTLVRGEQTLTAEHDSTAKVTAFEGGTIVNLAPLFDSGLWTLPTNYTVVSPNKVTLVVSDLTEPLAYVLVPVKANTDYTLSLINGGGNVAILNSAGTVTFKTYANNANPFTFNTANETLLAIYLRNPINTNGTFTFENIMLNEGTEAKPFVANVQGITNPTIENTITDDSITLLGTFHKGDVVSEDKGQYSVLRAKKEIVLDGFLAWVLYNQQNGFKTIRLPFTRNQIVLTEKVVKYNGAILSQGFDKSSDQSWLDETNLFITVSNTDSGWGDSYTPTADEIKAYFLGWTMRDTSGALYNRTDGLYKRWHPLVDKDMAYWSPTSLTTTVDRVPTIQAHRTLPNVPYVWQPNKLVYDLANPVKEQVQAINSVLKLAKGDNTLQVSEGRIVREKANVAYDSNNAFINSIHPGYEQSRLKYKTSKILSVYKNGELDTNWIHQSDSVTYGNDKVYIPIANFDKIAVYTVDYEPLYPFEVTAPTNPITIKYQSNLASVVNQNVEDIVELKEDVAIIERDMVRKGEGLEWVKPTLLNGWVNYATTNNLVSISKDSLNTVFIKGWVKSGAVSTVIFYLPKGYRPSDSRMFPVNATNNFGVIEIRNDGMVICRVSANTSYVVLDGISFKAEQ